MRLKHWTAKQAGGRISITGINEAGERETVTRCTQIDQKEHWYYDRSWWFGPLRRVVRVTVVAYHPTRGIINLV